MIRKLAHLNFVTNDLEKIVDFYVNKLSLPVKLRCYFELMEYDPARLQLTG